MWRFIKNFLLIPTHDEESLEEVEKGIISRYSRGNIYLERGAYITEEGRQKLRKRAAKLRF
jgi:hypothetical protein